MRNRTSPSPLLIFRVWEVREALHFYRETRDSPCTCTSFVIETQGCSCGKAARVALAVDALEQYVSEL